MSQKNDIIGPPKPASPQFASVEGEYSEQKMPLVPLIRDTCVNVSHCHISQGSLAY